MAPLFPSNFYRLQFNHSFQPFFRRLFEMTAQVLMLGLLCFLQFGFSKDFAHKAI